MDLILVRHGECGTTSTDDTLTPLGERQALQVGQRLTALPVTALLSSPLLRALGTANIIAQQTGMHPIEVWTELREGLDSTYQGCGREYLHQLFPLAILPLDIGVDGWKHGDDTQETMFERCHQILTRLHACFAPEDTIVIIAHGGILTYLLHVILHISPQTPAWFALDYGSISRISFVPKERRQAYLPLYPEMEAVIHSINDKTHL